MDQVLETLTAAASSAGGRGVKPLHGYIATALTGVNKDARKAMAFTSSLIAGVCKEFNIYVYQPRKATDPLLHPELEPAAVYARDRKRVLGANLLIIIADSPSFGVGQEIEIAASFGVPTIIISDDTTGPMSRMVTGSFLNLIGEIKYRNPEDLADKMRELLGNNLARIRSFKSSMRPDAAIPQRIGARLREMRRNVGLKISEAAGIIGVSPRLVKAVEEGPLNYHNVTLHIVGRMLVTYGYTTFDLFEPAAAIDRSPRAADHNIRSLERIASQMSWSVADFLQLRDEYERTRAASGDSLRIDDDGWLQKHSALEKRKMQDDRAKDKSDQEELFDDL